jgi:hypothetical protein
VPQPARGRRPGPQARGATRSDRARPGRDLRARETRHAARRRPDRAGRRACTQALPGQKHFQVQITDTTFTYQRNTEQIKAEAALDGIYVLRTSVTDTELDNGEVVRSYKQLKRVERAFRTFKGPELQIRPIHHRLEDRVRAHVLLCMLAYYLTWHLRQAWTPLLFQDENPPAQPDPVAKALRSRSAQRKAQTKRTTTGQPAHSYKSLLAELATLTRNTIRLPGTPATFNKLATPTPTQAQALELAETAHVLT